VDSKFNHIVKNFTPINERLCVIRIEGRFFNCSIINIHAPTNDSEEEAKYQFYEQLERAYVAWPSCDVKLVMGDANAKVGQETIHQTTIGKHSLHESRSVDKIFGSCSLPKAIQFAEQYAVESLLPVFLGDQSSRWRITSRKCSCTNTFQPLYVGFNTAAKVFQYADDIAVTYQAKTLNVKTISKQTSKY
jgi:hypothetical protein